MYVETILEVHHKYNALVLTAFNNDAGFVAALDKVRTVLLEGTNPFLQRDSPIQIKLTECRSSQSHFPGPISKQKANDLQNHSDWFFSTR